MKLSIVSGLNESKSKPEEVESKFSSLCEFLKFLTYDGIELSLLEPEKIDVKKIVEIKDSYSFEIPSIGTGGTFVRLGYSLGHIDDIIRRKAIERIERYAEFASETQSKVVIGLIRGRYNQESSPKKEKANIVTSLKECCRVAENIGVGLIFEPINSFEVDSYNTISESIELIRELGFDNIKLLIDSFHINLEEDLGFVWDYIKEISDLIGHVHLADCTRRAPGTGHFDFKNFLSILKEAGYNGYASIETIMKPSFEEVARTSIEYLRLIL